MLEIEELDFEGMSAIRVRYALVQSRVWKYLRYLIVRYSGVYRDGSQGNPDAMYMHAMAEAGIAAYDITGGVIIDLSELSYRWGDMIEGVYSGTERGSPTAPFPLAVIAGPDCAPALASLEWGVGTRRKAGEMDEIFDTLDEAVTWLDGIDRPDGERL